MRANCRCKKCGLLFNQPLTRSKVGCSILYNKYWKPIKCANNRCTGLVESFLRTKLENVNIAKFSAQNKDYLKK